MTVLHVQKVSGVSGSEAHLLSLLPLLRARGWDVRMLVLHEGEEGALEFMRAMRDRGVPTESWRMRLDLDPTVPARIALRSPRILHTHLIHADVLCLPAAVRAGARVSTKHGFNEFRANPLVAAADRFAARFADAQIAISHGLANYLAARERLPREQFEIVHYGIAAGPDPPVPPAATRLAAVGRLIPIKGFDVLLQAFGEARSELPELTLEIAGAGPLGDELRVAAPAGVTFLGRVSPIADVYERNAIVVVPSRGEGFGMVALEAAERGRAAVVSDVGGLPEIVVDGETGLVVPADSPRALARAIVDLASSPDRVRAYGDAARRRALTSFTEEEAAAGVERVYRSIAAAPSNTRRKSKGTR